MQARAAEDTALIMLTGVVVNSGLPAGVSAKFEALPFLIYYAAAQYMDESQLLRGFGAALVLLLLSALRKSAVEKISINGSAARFIVIVAVAGGYIAFSRFVQFGYLLLIEPYSV